MQVAKWGNSLAIRIPADVVKALNLKAGDEVNLRALDDGELVMMTEDRRRALAVEALRSLRGTAPKDFKFDREEANAR